MSMIAKSHRLALGLAISFSALTCQLATPALAADDVMTPITTPAQPTAIELGTGALPGATAQESWHQQYGSQFARNLVEPGSAVGVLL